MARLNSTVIDITSEFKESRTWSEEDLKREDLDRAMSVLIDHEEDLTDSEHEFMTGVLRKFSAGNYRLPPGQEQMLRNIAWKYGR